MVRLLNMPALDIINGFKGLIDFYVHDGQPCARRWPRSPGHQRAASVKTGWLPFAYAARAWNYLDPAVKQDYRQTATGTNLSGRDLFVKAYITHYIKEP